MIDRDALADIAEETIHAVNPGRDGRPSSEFRGIAEELADRVQAAVSQQELIEWLVTALPGSDDTREADARTVAGAVFEELDAVSSSPLIEQLDPEAPAPSA